MKLRVRTKAQKGDESIHLCSLCGTRLSKSEHGKASRFYTGSKVKLRSDFKKVTNVLVSCPTCERGLLLRAGTRP